MANRPDAIKIFIVDPHLHFFDLAKGDYHWLAEHNPPHWNDKCVIQQNFSHKDLTLPIDICLKGFVHIEAGFDNQNSDKELAWLEQLMQSEASNYACIAYIDVNLPAEMFRKRITCMQEYPSFRGIRYMFDETSNTTFTQNGIIQNLRELADHNLIFECQLDVADSSQTALLENLLQQLPMLKCIVNHAGMAPKSLNENWHHNMQKLSCFNNVFMKCSGFEMANRAYTQAHVESVLLACINIFGERRVLCASNFPLTLFSMSYSEYWCLMLKTISNLGFQPENLCYQNAIDAYSFDHQ